MNKLSDDSGSMGTQMGLLKNRVSGLEEELSRVREEKTDQVFEIRKLTQEKERLTAEIQKVNTQNV